MANAGFRLCQVFITAFLLIACGSAQAVRTPPIVKSLLGFSRRRQADNFWFGKSQETSRLVLCKGDDDCDSRSCVSGTCVELHGDELQVLHRNFKKRKECMYCEHGWQCYSNVCWQNKCFKQTYSSKRKCYGAKECEQCQGDGDCQKGRCWNGKCIFSDVNACFYKKTECQNCTADNQCAHGLLCKTDKPGGTSLCATVVGVGESCLNPCRICEPGLKCQDGACAKAKNDICGPCHSNQHCETGLVCKDMDNTGICAEPREAGKRCDDRCWTCQENLNCEKGKMCKARHCGQCRGNYQCKDYGGFVCISGRCAKISGVNGLCGDPCWTCDKGLTCKGADGKTCEKLLSTRCEHCVSTEDCVTGMECKAGKCATPVDVGGNCLDACNICKKNLLCKNGSCIEDPNLQCGKCSADDDCEGDSVCISGVCRKTVNLGGKCSDPCSVCSSSLVCHDGKTCEMPPEKECAACTDDGKCNEGYTCKSGKCVVDMGPGRPCSEACWSCQAGLICAEDKVCRKHVSQQCGACLTDDDCADDLSCSFGKCARTIGIGTKCSDPCWICADGLVCNGDVCEKAPAEMCEQCTEEYDCATGLTCVSGKCIKTRKVGGTCKAPCESCDEMTVCDGETCQYHQTARCGNCSEDIQCDGDLKCESGKCVKLVELNGSCSQECHICAIGMSCKNNKCRKDQNDACESCQKDADCAEGLRCKKGICAEQRALGERCDEKCASCEYGLECKDGKQCAATLCGECIKDEDCVDGTVCKRNTCTTTVGLGEQCTHPCISCQSGLFCKDGLRCEKERSEKCGECATDDECMAGLKCDAGICVKIVGVDKFCAGSCQKCSKDLICENGKICRHAREKKCGVCHHDEDCEHNLRCAHGKCHKIVWSRQQCGDNCTKCGDGFVCIDSKCRLRPTKSKQCGECSNRQDCEWPLDCLSEVCVRIGQIGDACSAECSECATGLICKGGKCAKHLSEQCGVCAKDDDCETGLSCSNRRCMKRMGMDGDCSQRCVTCEDGLICRYGRTCMKQPVKPCGACEQTKDCMTGTVCSGSKCTQMLDVGDACPGQCSKCDFGLSCSNGVCEMPKSPVCALCWQDEDCKPPLKCRIKADLDVGKCATETGKGGDCSDECSICGAGLTCAGGTRCTEKSDRCGLCSHDDNCLGDMVCKQISSADGSTGKCATTGALDEDCRGECSACRRDNLACKDGRKCAVKSGQCGYCTSDDHCAAGLKCRMAPGANGIGRCAVAVGMGDSCEDACGICDEGLVCKDGTTCTLPGM